MARDDLEPAAAIAARNPYSFPNESAAYRSARNALLQEEVELRRHLERVAQMRRDLPPGTPVVSLKFRFPRAAWRPERVENDTERGKVYFYRT